MSTLTAQAPGQIAASTLTRADRIPWFIWASAAAAACIMSGVYWDISWHQTIGRDTFWTPAHLLIQFGAVLAGIYSAYLIFSTTFVKDAAVHEASVSVLGFRGPLGAFISAWGGVAMIVSAPFDNWWHNAYGLDVKIVSPPHALLAMGIIAIAWGSIILILGHMSRADAGLRRRLQRLLLCAGGFIVIQEMMFKLEFTNRVLMHSAIFYVVVTLGMGIVLEGVARSSGYRWARTAITGFYTCFFLLGLWILPLFPGQPKLGPVYQHVTHMVSLHFPVLIVVPAFVLDIIFPRIKDWNKWAQAAIESIIFVAVLLAVCWPLGTFLVYWPAARNWFFGTQQFAYFLDPTLSSVRNIFFQGDSTRAMFFFKMGIAVVAGILSMRIGIAWGNWLARVRR